MRNLVILVATAFGTGCGAQAVGAEVSARQDGRGVQEVRDVNTAAEPGAVLTRAEMAFRAGRLDDALTDALWCYDNGTLVDPGFWGVWIARVPGLLAELAVQHAPARGAADARLAAFEARVRNREPEAALQMLGVATLYDGLNQRARLWRVLESTIADSGAEKHYRARVLAGAMDVIVAAGRYDLVAPLAEEIVAADRDLRGSTPIGQDLRLDALLIRRAGIAYESLLRAGEGARAVLLSDSLLAEYRSIDAYATMVRAARGRLADIEVERILASAERALPAADVATLRGLALPSP